MERRWTAVGLGALAVALSSCAHHSLLEPVQRRLAVQDGDEACGPVGIRRVALASRWGEYFEVRVEGPGTVFGEARVHVGGKPQPLVPFTSATGDRIVRLAWKNERLSIPSALEKNAVIDLTLLNLHTSGATCEGVRFTVTQGAFVPDRGEEEWIAELIARGGADVATWRTQQAEEKAAAARALVLAHPPAMPWVPARSLEWATWTGEDPSDPRAQDWARWPYSRDITLATEGSAMAKGSFVVWRSLAPEERAITLDTIRRLGGAPPSSPAALGSVLERAAKELGSEDAAVAALFVGIDTVTSAIARRGPALEAFAPLARRSNPLGFDRALMSLSMGRAFSLGWPVAARVRVSSPFGNRTHPTLGVNKLHTGVDLSLPEGSPVRASGDGVVLRVAEDPVSGRFVVIDHGHGVTTAYCHNSKVLVAEGQPIARGELVSESGNTGRSTGPHLHYQLEINGRPIDPFLFQVPPALAFAQER